MSRMFNAIHSFLFSFCISSFFAFLLGYNSDNHNGCNEYLCSQENFQISFHTCTYLVCVFVSLCSGLGLSAIVGDKLTTPLRIAKLFGVHASSYLSYINVMMPGLWNIPCDLEICLCALLQNGRLRKS